MSQSDTKTYFAIVWAASFLIFLGCSGSEDQADKPLTPQQEIKQMKSKAAPLAAKTQLGIVGIVQSAMALHKNMRDLGDERCLNFEQQPGQGKLTILLNCSLPIKQGEPAVDVQGKITVTGIGSAMGPTRLRDLYNAYEISIEGLALDPQEGKMPALVNAFFSGETSGAGQSSFVMKGKVEVSGHNPQSKTEDQLSFSTDSFEFLWSLFSGSDSWRLEKFSTYDQKFSLFREYLEDPENDNSVQCGVKGKPVEIVSANVDLFFNRQQDQRNLYSVCDQRSRKFQIDFEPTSGDFVTFSDSKLNKLALEVYSEKLSFNKGRTALSRNISGEKCNGHNDLIYGVRMISQGVKSLAAVFLNSSDQKCNQKSQQ